MNEDIITYILADPECQMQMKKVMKQACLDDPLSFYKKFVMPRMSKFKEPLAEFEPLEITLAQMEQATAPPEPNVDKQKHPTHQER